MAELKGIYPILATPFGADGEVDEKSFERLIEFLGGSGVQGLTLFGMAGEYYKLSDNERRALEAIFLKSTRGRLKRIVSVTEHSIELARKRAREAAEAGADALMVMPPFFLSPDTGAVREHIREIALAVAIPIVVQYSPNQTGLRLPPRFFVDLTQEFPDLQYVKVDSTPAGPLISSLVKMSDGRIKPFVGYAGLQMVDAFARGAVGCMPGCSLSEPYVEIYSALARGDRNQAARLHGRLLPLINYMMQSLEFIIQCEKTILCWRGMIASDYCRHPRTKLTADDLRALRELLESAVPQLTLRDC
jgi:4-hydroxy-tetrahydrodipicolinate synthase